MTAQQLIEGALRLIDVLSAPGMSANTLEYDAALAALNELIASWSSEGVMLYSIVQDQHSLTGAASYTWGTGGAINTPRPEKIKSARVNSGNVSLPVEIVNSEEWNAIIDRTLTGAFARKLYADGGYPLTTIYLWPSPSSGTLILHSYKPLTGFAGLSDTVTFPPGYEIALRYNLAIALAPEYRKPVPPEVPPIAAQTKGALAALNAQVLGLPAPAGAAPAPAAGPSPDLGGDRR